MAKHGRAPVLSACRPLGAGLLIVAALGGMPVQVAAIDTASYRAAAASGTPGAVAGRIYEERKRPELPDHPLAGAAVVVVPRSSDVLRKLEEIKRGARNSDDDYRAAAPSILAVRRAYEKELWDSGAVDLVKSTTVDVEGRFVVADLPAGDWLLFATHTVKIDKHAGLGPKQRGVYTPRTHLTGFQRVTIWLREVTISSGRSESVDLTDRGAWFSGVVEERAPDAGR
jgi:hypothetical protein